MIHLSQGDPEPEINSNKLTLYDFKFCPYCIRVRYTLDYHKLPYDRILINLVNKPDWYLKLYPTGKMPLLRYRGEKLAESEVIMRYVDELKGGKDASLLKVCGEDKFKDALALASVIFQPRYKIVYRDPTMEDVENLLAACGKLEDAIVGPYLYGNDLSLADMALAPFLNGWKCVLQRIGTVAPDYADEKYFADKYPKLTAYRKKMQSEDFAKATEFTDDEYIKYVEINRAKDTSARY